MRIDLFLGFSGGLACHRKLVGKSLCCRGLSREAGFLVIACDRGPQFPTDLFKRLSVGTNYVSSGVTIAIAFHVFDQTK